MLLSLLAAANGDGLSVSKNTLVVVALVLAIIFLLMLIVGRGRPWRR